MLAAAVIVRQDIATFTEFPPSQAPPDFNAQAIVHEVVNAASQRQGN